MDISTLPTTFRLGGQLEVLRLGLGAMRLTGPGIWGEPEDRDECVRVVRRAVELGINLIDTADSYGRGRSERLLGRAFTGLRRESLVILTKVCFPTGPGPNDHGLSRKHIRSAIDGSLWFNTNEFINTPQQNIGVILTKGADLTAHYRLNIGGAGRLSFGLTGTYVRNFDVQPVPTLPAYDCSGLWGSTCGAPLPKWRHVLSTTWGTPWAGLDVTLRWRLIGKATVDRSSSDLLLAQAFYPYTAHIPNYNYIDLAAAIPIRTTPTPYPLDKASTALADLAHVLTLDDLGIIPPEDTNALIGALLEMSAIAPEEFPYDPAYGDPWNSRERRLEALAGPRAGWRCGRSWCGWPLVGDPWSGRRRPWPRRSSRGTWPRRAGCSPPSAGMLEF